MPTQTDIPAIKPFNLIEWVFALSAQINSDQDLTLADGLDVVERMEDHELLAFNHLPMLDDFASAMNSLVGPVYDGASVSDPSLFVVRQAIVELLQSSRYLRGPGDEMLRESFVVCPMVLFSGQRNRGDVRFDTKRFSSPGGLSPRLLNLLSDRYGGIFAHVSPLLSMGHEVAYASDADDDHGRSPCFDEVRDLSQEAITHGTIDIESLDCLDWQDKFQLSDATLFRGVTQDGEVCGPRMHVFLLGLTHLSHVGKCHRLFTRLEGIGDFLDVSKALRADLPSIVGPESSIILLSPRLLRRASSALDSLRGILGRIQGKSLFTASQADSFIGAYMPPYESNGRHCITCGIIEKKHLHHGVPTFEADRSTIDLIDVLFKHACSANHVEITHTQPA